MLTYLSLFSGIGGLDLAVESLGYECVGQVEWDSHATAVLERWWPGVPRWSDVHGFTAAAYTDAGWRLRGPLSGTELHGRGRSKAPDLIIGGFPCQPASTAGRRKGTADDRWLWPQFARVIGELGPRHVLVENVPGLTTVNGGRAFSEILGTLADLGYDATWTSLRASDVGACHRRERIFLLANARDGDDAERTWTPRREAGERASVGSESRHDAPHTDDRRHEPKLRPPHLTGPEAEGDPGAEPGGAGGRVATDTDRQRVEGTEPQRIGNGVHPLSSNGDRFPWGAYGPAIERWERTLNRCAPHPVDDKGRLAPPFVEWMMGFPPGWTDASTRTQALKQLGNAVVPAQGAAALAYLLGVEGQG